jgi:hypothetical protein
MEFEDESLWLRHRVVRLRAALRFAREASVEAILRELIADGEERLISLEDQGVTTRVVPPQPPLRPQIPATPAAPQRAPSGSGQPHRH